MINMTETLYLESDKYDFISENTFSSLINNKLKKNNGQHQHSKPLELINEDFDLTQDIIKIPESPFLIKVNGDSMMGCGIESGDTLLVDKTKKPCHGDVVIAALNKKLLVKRLNYSYRETMLLSENDNYMPIKIYPSDKFEIWGVATMVIKDLNNN
jgi:DNA polymerase V